MVQWFSFTAKTTKNDWDVSAIHIWNSILLPICPSPFPTNLFSSSSPSQQHLTSLNSYELHFSKLTLALSKMEGTVRQEQEEKVFKGAHLATVVTLHTHTHTHSQTHTTEGSACRRSCDKGAVFATRQNEGVPLEAAGLSGN